MTSMTAARTGPLTAPSLRGRLGVYRLTALLVCGVAPLVVYTGVVPTGFSATGVIALPAAVLAAALLLLAFLVGYTRMAARIPNAGALYTYIARGAARPAGVGAAWVTVVAYNALQVGLYGLIGAAAAPLAERWLGIGTLFWVWPALAAWAITAILGVLKAEIGASLLFGLVLLEIGVTAVYTVANLAHPHNGSITYSAFNPAPLLSDKAGPVLTLVILFYIGVEMGVLYTREARSPETVPRAMRLAIAIIGVLYTIAPWALVVAVGENQIAARGADGPGLVFGLAAQFLGPDAATTGEALLLTSVLAGLVSFHGASARSKFLLGREGVIPTVFGRIWGRTTAPVVGSLAQSGIGAAVICGYWAAGVNDPMITLFYYGGAVGAIGIVAVMAATSVSVARFLHREPAAETLWQRTIAPGISAVLLTAVCASTAWNTHLLIGVGPGDPLRWIIPGSLAAVGVAGAVWAVYLRRQQHIRSSRYFGVYTAVGYGAYAATTRHLRPSQEAAR